MTLSRAIVRFGGLTALAVLIIFAVASGWWRDLTPADLRAHYGGLVKFTGSYRGAAVAVFALVGAAVTATCLPGIGFVVVLGGALFGALEGGAASLFGIVLGSTCVFLACRAASPDRFGGGSDGRIGRLIAVLSRHGFSTLLVLRLTPVAPLSLVNIAAGLARVRLVPFLAASLIGSAPSNFVYAAVGAGLRRALAGGAVLSPAMLARPTIVLPLVGLAALAGLAAVVNARRRR